MGRLSVDSWSRCQSANSNARASIPDANPDGLTVRFTGTPFSLGRKEAHTHLAEVGGQPAAGATRKTNVLVIGAQDPAKVRREQEG